MDEEATQSASEDGAERLSLMKRLKRNPLRKLAIGGGVLALCLAGAYVMSLTSSSENLSGNSPERAIELLEAGEYDQAKHIATVLEKRGNLATDELGVPTYVVGAALAYEADAEWDDTRKRALNMIAARYLQEALAKGFPEGFESNGHFLLAKSLYQSGFATQSVPSLVSAHHSIQDEDRSREVLRMLADVHFRDPQLDAEEGLKYVKQYCNEETSPENLQKGKLLWADLLIRSAKFDEAEQLIQQEITTFDEFDSAVADWQVRLGLVWLGRSELLREESINRSDPALKVQSTQALALAREAFEKAEVGPESGSMSRYYLAVCAQREGRMADAVERFGEVRRELADTMYSIPAGLGEAESIQLGGDIDLAVKRFTLLLESAELIHYEDTPWLSKRDFQTRMIDAHARLRDSGRFKMALELAKQMWPPLDRDVSVELQALTHSQWGSDLLKQAEQQEGEAAEKLQSEARNHLREAGLAYFKLARLQQAGENYIDHLWNAAEHYYDGREYPKAISLYRQYLDEPPETRAARAYLRIGEAMLASGDLDGALDALKRCILFYPNDSDAFRARLVASRVYVDRNRLDEAKELLLYNLESGDLTPDSLEWRDSLFALGEAMFHEALLKQTEAKKQGLEGSDQRKIQEAMVTLKESHDLYVETAARLSQAVVRYGNDESAIEAKYLLAQAFKNAAAHPKKELELTDIQGKQFQLKVARDNYLSKAYDAFSELESFLMSELDRRRLSETEQRILRNCTVAKGDTLFDQERYEDAIEMYQSVSNRYYNQPISIEAFCRMASCYRRLGRYPEARGVLNQAKVFLDQRIPKDADYLKTTRYDRSQWIVMLDWLSSQ